MKTPARVNSLTGAPCEMNRLRAIQTHTQIQTDSASGLKSHSLMGPRQSRSFFVLTYQAIREKVLQLS